MSKQELVKAAKRILAGDLDPLEGCRLIVRIEQLLPKTYRDDPDLLTLVAIESETDHFAMGEARSYWTSSALEEQDRGRAAYVAKNGDVLRSACRNLIAKISGHRR
jgi:hypothetical protein